MKFSPGNIYHVYNQGNDHQLIFHSRNDYLIFLNLYRRLVVPFTDTIAWTLMPNHFHFMLHCDKRCDMKIKQGNVVIDPISNGFRKLLSGYARIFNTHKGRSGSVFRQKTKAKCLSDVLLKDSDGHDSMTYYTNCFHYIHQNPLKAGLVKRMEEWEFSSFQDYAGLRKGSLCKKQLAELYCQYERSSFVEKSYEMVNRKIIEVFD
jgi:putative transposase